MNDHDNNSAFFLGAELHEDLLSSLDPKLLKIFGSYLDHIKHDHHSYLGKIISEPLNLEQLQQLESHILSVFQRLGVKHPLPTCKLLCLNPQTSIMHFSTQAEI